LIQRTKWALAFALLVGTVLVAATAVALYPRWHEARRRAARKAELARLLERPDDDARAEALAAFADDPVAVTALVVRAVKVGREGLGHVPLPWRRAVELWALTPEPRDPRPLDQMETFLRDGRLEDGACLELLYLREELRDPTYAPARDLPARPWLEGSHEEVLAKLQAIVPLEVEQGLVLPPGSVEGPPSFALAWITQAAHGRLAREGGGFKIWKRSAEFWSMCMNMDPAEPVTSFGFDPSWGPTHTYARVEYEEPPAVFWLLGRGRMGDPSFNSTPDGDMDVMKGFRAICALRGYGSPQRIADHVFEAAPVTSR
jgi:hypothetical protein